MADFNFKGMEMDITKLKQFKEFLNFTLQKKTCLDYHDFRQNCGISRAQWDQFKLNNNENEIKWSVE
ncbi:MAG: hypothetical protein WC471_02775 [Candidatus Woesearchaeota archaeon]